MAEQQGDVTGRSLLTATAIVVGCFVLPMAGSLALGGLVVLLGGLTAIFALIAWQIRAVLRSPGPAVRAIDGPAPVGVLAQVLAGGVQESGRRRRAG